MNARRYAEAVSRYTTALSVDPAGPQGLLIKRSNAWVGKDARDNAMNDATEWARSMPTSGSWKDALSAGVSVSISCLVIRCMPHVLGL